jgi:hypothetical protein
MMPDGITDAVRLVLLAVGCGLLAAEVLSVAYAFWTQYIRYRNMKLFEKLYPHLLEEWEKEDDYYHV